MEESRLSALLVHSDDPMGPNLEDQIRKCGAHVERADPRASATQILDLAMALKAPGVLILSSSTFFPDQGSHRQLIKLSAGKIPLIAVGAACDLLAASFKGRILRKKGDIERARVEIKHDRSGVLSGVVSPFFAAVHTPTIVTAPPPGMVARATSFRGVMLIEHEVHPMIGIRFRPDSIATNAGSGVIRALLDWAAQKDPR